MKKIILLTVCMTASMAISADNIYKKVTTNLSDWSGTYLILHEYDETDSAAIFNGGLTDLDSKNNYIPEALLKGSDDVRYIPETEYLKNATFTIAKSTTSGCYTIQSHSGYWIGYNSSDATDASLKSSNTKSYDNTIAMTDTSTSVNIFSKNGFVLRWNGDAESMRFRYYSPYKKKGIKLYKQTDASAIKEVKVDGIDIEDRLSSTESPVVYDIMGRPVTSFRKGDLYIVDGKKVWKSR